MVPLVVAAIVGLVVGIVLAMLMGLGASRQKCDSYVGAEIKALIKKFGGKQLPQKASEICFHGDSLVKMANGQMKEIRSIRKGDVVYTRNGPATVKCLTVSQTNGKTELVNVNGLLVTPYHPVKVNGEWKFPTDVADVEMKECEAVFNLVLDKNHSININGVEAVTLGHDFKGPVVGHEYFGSQKVINDLKNTEGWKDGIVFVYGGKKESETINYIVEAPTLTVA
jgi:hypothetical protein